MFWGAPLVARELETGTHRLVWNQSVTRRRWLLAKLLVVGLASVAVTGVFSGLLSWAAGPFDLVAGDRFHALQFGARNLAPMAYAAFAFTAGAVLGMLLRRTVAAMALTALVFAVVQIVMPTMIRPHLVPPVTVDHPMTADSFRNLTFLGSRADIGGLRFPDAWIVSTSRLLTAGGEPVDQRDYDRCLGAGFDAMPQCLAGLDLHVRVSYQPGERYWSFQLLESGLFLAGSVVLAGVGVWRVQRGG